MRRNPSPLSLRAIAELTQSRLIGNEDTLIQGVSDLESATEQDASFLGSSRYEQAMRRSKAGVIFISALPEDCGGRCFLITPNPSLAFQTLINHFYDPREGKTGFIGIHPTAVIHPTAKIDEGVCIAPYVVIDQGVCIGARTSIGPGTTIGPSTSIGADCIIHAHVTLRELCVLGNRVILQPGCVIGSCGFGYISDAKGHHIKLDQVGTVIIEDDVEIGANATIDRSRFKETRIGKGTKIDNLVQIGHGVQIGEDNIIVSQAGIAGSTQTGRHVVIGGQVGIAGHIKIGDRVMVAARSGVSKSIQKEGKYGGVPAVPLDQYNRNAVLLRRIEDFVEELKELKEKIVGTTDPQSSSH